MAYKDKEKQKQKQAQKERTRRYRDKAKGVTLVGVTQGVTNQTVTVEVKAEVLPANFGQPNCRCLHCRSNKVNGNRHTLNHGAYKTANELGHNELNRVSLPGDVDYTGVATELMAIGVPDAPETYVPTNPVQSTTEQQGHSMAINP